MRRVKAMTALILVFSLMVLTLGCESEHTAPERVKHEPVDPVDWDGTKGSPPGTPTVSDGPSTEWSPAGFDAGERSMGMELGPHDHTIIMEAVLHNVPEIATHLPENGVASGTGVLQAALLVSEIGPYVKGRIRKVLEYLPLIEQTQARLPDNTRQALSEISADLEECETLSEMTETMQNMLDSGLYESYEGLPEGLETGIAILYDGEKTVYRARFLFSLKRLAQHDAQGAITGAVTGGFIGGPPGAAAGAAIGAVGSSAADAFGQLTGWW